MFRGALFRSSGRAVILLPALTLLILAPGPMSRAEDWAIRLGVADSVGLFLAADPTGDDPWGLTGVSPATLSDFQEPATDPGGPVPLGEEPEEPQEPLGQAPEDTSLLFLRTAQVLLEPGQWDLDTGFAYTWNEIQRPAIVGTFRVVDTERYRLRQFLVPWGVRVGVAKRTQAFAYVPVGAVLSELANPTADGFNSVGGLGDVTAGVNYQFRRQDSRHPDIVGSLYFTAPTGPHAFRRGPFNPLMNDVNVAVLGSGFWGVTAHLNFVKSYDPAVVYAGIGYTHQFSRHHLLVDPFLQQEAMGFVDPGEVFSYQFGMGFAINNRLTVSSTFQGALQTTWVIDHHRVPGSSTEPFALRFALTASVSRSYIVEPFLTFGLNDDAAAVDFGVVSTQRF